MEQYILTLDDYIAITKRRRWYLFGPAIIIFVAAIVVAMLLPTLYRSTSTILIEQQEIPIDLVRSTVTSYADQRIQVIRQRVMTTLNLTKIIERFNLYEEIRAGSGMASAVEKMRQEILLEMISADVVDPRSGRPAAATIAFTLSYKSESATLAQRVANDIVSLFLDENLRERKRTAEDATRFLNQESDKLAEQVSLLEGRLAQFKELHGDAIPEMMQVNLQLIERTETRLSQIEQEIRALEVNQVYLEYELAKSNPYSTMYSLSGERILTPGDRLKTLETELISARSRYSTTHPDRIAIEREIETLRNELGRRDTNETNRMLAEQRNELSRLRARYSAEHPDIKSIESQIADTELSLATPNASTIRSSDSDADNPAYIQLKSQKAANQSKIDALVQTRTELAVRLADLEKRITEAPKVEREYRLITRDYESAVAKYNEVQGKLMEASLAETLETERKGERFTLIEPPTSPAQPFSPNRPAIIFVGFFLAIGAGIGVTAIGESIDPALNSLRSIQVITGAAPLAIIPVIRTAAYQRKRKLRLVLGVIFGVVTITVSLILVTDVYGPLDVLWFRVVNRFLT